MAVGAQRRSQSRICPAGAGVSLQKYRIPGALIDPFDDELFEV